MNALINFSEYKDGDAFRAPLDFIVDFHKGNIRKRRDEKKFNELRAAIRASHGVTQGVTVRISPDDPTKLELLAGYGRVAAARLEGFDDIPVVYKVASDKEAEAIMLSENLVREDLSIPDEIEAAQRYVSHFDGDYTAAAGELGWTVKRLRARLAMNQCSDEVLDAVRDGSISLGHAEILSAFTPKLQNGTLTKIISENWSLDYLKERAGKANRLLKTAFFDIAGCEGCPNNSSYQAELFDNTVGKARCNNLECFREKTDAALEVRKAELEEEYGIVMLAIDKPVTDRITVSASTVGEIQFTSGCTGCEKNVVILKDGINADCGQVETNQCISSSCNREMVKQFKDALALEKASIQESSKPAKTAVKSKDGKPSKTASSENTKAASQATPSKVVATNDLIIREIGARHFDGNAHFVEALAVATMIHQCGASHIPDEIKKLAGVEFRVDVNTTVIRLYQLSEDVLNEIKLSVAFAYMGASVNGTVSSEKLAAFALSKEPEGKNLAIAGWVPTKEILSGYTSAVLTQMAKDSGFASYIDEKKGEGTFIKAAKQKKGDLVATLLNSEFDWSNYAPADYLKRLA